MTSSAVAAPDAAALEQPGSVETREAGDARAPRRPLRLLAASLSPRRSTPRTAVALAYVAAAAATIWSAATHSMLLYGDARAHLNVARHVTDGLQTGFTQLGSVWLPMPHLLLVPFTASRLLWHSGMAGAIVGVECFAYASVRIFNIVDDLTDNRLAAWCGFLLFIANLNMLYVQSTALTEPVLLAFMIGATYHFVRWMRTLSVRELMWAAILTMLATLTRYEGWALLIAGVCVVAYWGLLADRRRKSQQANLVLYTIVGGYGILLWFIYNLTIFGDPLYFLHSQYSAQVINGSQARFGLLGTKGNLVESLLTYGWDVAGVVGPLVLIAAAVSVVVLSTARDARRRRILCTLALLGAPVAFEVVSLYLGQTTIRVPQRLPHGMWNDRYGLVALPLCVVAIATVFGRKRILGALVVITGVLGTASLAFGTPLTLADGRTGTSSAAAGRPERAAAFLHANYRGGEILADDSAASAFMFATDLDLKEFVSPGFGRYWRRTLVAPGSYVRWVVAVPGDAISAGRKHHPDRFSAFRLVFTDRDIKVYKFVNPEQRTRAF